MVDPCMLGCRACIISRLGCAPWLASGPHLPLEEVLVPADELELLLPVDRVVLVDVDQTLSHPQVLGQNVEQLPHRKVNKVKTGQEVEETLPEKCRISCLNVCFFSSFEV